MNLVPESHIRDERQIADSISRLGEQVKNIEASCGKSLRTLILRAEIARLQGLQASCQACRHG